MSVCARDCLHCPYPDCVCDEMDYADYQAADRLEREIIHPRTARQERIAAQQRAWYEANREHIAAQQRAYYEANRERIAAQQRAWYEANRERYNAYQRKYYHRKREEAAPNGA